MMKVGGRQIIGYVVCAAGFFITLWAFYPGLMSPDSIAAMNEGRSGLIYDQNSAIMALVWGWLDRIVPGPGLMLVFQNAVFWTAIACLWQAVYRESLAAGLAILAFPFMPQVLSQLPVIWKDVQMAAALLMAAGLVFLAKKTGNKVALFLSPVFLFYGFAARLNSFPAVLPIAIWSGFVGWSLISTERSRLVPATIGISYFVFLAITVLLANMWMTEGRTSYPFQYVMLHDLAAITIASNTSMFPQYAMAEDYSMEKLNERYSPISMGDLVYPDPSRPQDAPILVVTEDPGKIAELRARWRDEALRHPLTYVWHRTRIFAHLIGVGRSVTGQYWDLTLTRNPPEFAVESNVAGRSLNSYFALFGRPAMQTFFRGIIWLLVAAYFAYRAIKARLRSDWDFVFVMALSSLFYVAALFPTAPTTDYRFLLWPSIASAVAAIFGIYLLRKERVEVVSAAQA